MISNPKTMSAQSPKLRLCTDIAVVKSAFKKWHGVLTSGSEPIGSARQIDGSDVRYRQLVRHRDNLHLEFWVGSSESAAVQLNEPKVAGSENPGSTIAVDSKGRSYLVRQGDLHSNNQSGRIRHDDFAHRTALSPVNMRSKNARSRKQWYVVAQLDGCSSKEIRNATADFVSRCWAARTFGELATKDQKRLTSLFGNPERGGWYDINPTQTPKRVLLIQGYVYEQLEEVLGFANIKIQKPKHAAGYEVDGTIQSADGSILFEIKTGISAADVYCGVGQLALYPVVLNDLADHAKVLLLPGKPSHEFVVALKSIGVELYQYELNRSQQIPTAQFEARFLRRCGMPESTIDELVSSGRAGVLS